MIGGNTLNDYQIQLLQTPDSELYDTLEDTQLEVIGSKLSFLMYCFLFPSRAALQYFHISDVSDETITGDGVLLLLDKVNKVFPVTMEDFSSQTEFVRSVVLFHDQISKLVDKLISDFPQYLTYNQVESIISYFSRMIFGMSIPTVDYDNIIHMYTFLKHLGYFGELKYKS